MSDAPFIPARPRALDRRFWGAYFSWTLRRSFSAGYIAEEHHLVSASHRQDQIPTIIASTHASWWDAAVAMSIAFGRHRLDTDGMMEHRQLERYRFFSRLGMFSVIREDPQSSIRSLRYAASRLRGTNRMLWMYPQGTLIHQDVDRIECEPGLGILARLLGHCRILPVAMRYELLREQRPAVWVRFGEPVEITPSASIRDVQTLCSSELTTLRDDVRRDAMAEKHGPYEPLFTGRLSMEKRYDSVLRRSR
jgi:chlorobactene lauroyltransferase